MGEFFASQGQNDISLAQFLALALVCFCRCSVPSLTHACDVLLPGETSVVLRSALVPLLSTKACNHPEVYQGLISSGMIDQTVALEGLSKALFLNLC